MFDQLNQPEERPRVSAAMALGVFTAYLIGAFGASVLFIALSDRAFGIQIATIIVYTYFIFWYVFFPTRGLLEKYSLRNKIVQRQVPRLLVIHCAFLTLVVLGETFWVGMKSHLPGCWNTQHGKEGDTLYEGAWLVSSVLVFFIQVLVSRRILSKSMKLDSGKSLANESAVQPYQQPRSGGIR